MHAREMHLVLPHSNEVADERGVEVVPGSTYN